MTGSRIVVAGEAMLELSQDAAGWHIGQGGDTLNMAVHLARHRLDVAYLTAVGDDPLSTALRTETWPQAGVDTSLVLVDPARSTGLYIITTDEKGERRFSYWRRESAASALFGHPGISAAAKHCVGADLFVFSLISLAILPESQRQALLAIASEVRAAGGQTAFDGNYRPRLWEDADTARLWRDRAIALADFGLPTLEDERMLSGEQLAPEAVADHWRSQGAREVVVKLGPDGCLLPGGTYLRPRVRLSPVDTSGAGDAFNAAYLAARLRGAAPAIAAMAGHDLAGWVVMRRGAIPPLEGEAPYISGMPESEV